MNANLLRPVPVLASQLVWLKDDRMFVTELSDIGGRLGRVYRDAEDQGLTLISRYPEQEDLVMVVSHTETDPDDGIRFWDLEPASPVRYGVSFKVRVYND